MSPNPAVTFFMLLIPIGQDDSSFENGYFRHCLLFGKIRSAKMRGVYAFNEVNQDEISTTT